MPDLHIDLGRPASDAPTLPLDQVLDVSAQAVHAALEQHVHQHIARGQVNAAALGLLADDAVQEICKALRVDAFSLVFRAWAAVRELREYADPAKHPPGEVNVVRWGRCTVNAPQEVDVRVGVLGVELPVLRLRVDLRAEFDSLALTIRDGAIRRVTPGAAKATVALKCGSATLVPERSTPQLQFPHGVDFDPGLSLGWKQ